MSAIINEQTLFKHLPMDTIQSELNIWYSMWCRHKLEGKDIHKNVLESLSECDKTVFPTIQTIFAIICTLPISVASAERSFSTLKRVKTWLRSRMGNNRLSGLVLLHVHRDIKVNTDAIIERFA
ncbi:unnamed protein product [Macrosiphum euphorbiae]|nr:unnamed protein product [Macrosiphum euphorbiae]